MSSSAEEVLNWLKEAANSDHKAGLARYGIPTVDALGVPMAEIKRAARRFGRSHEIVFDLWDTGIYEARVMAIHLADPRLFIRTEADGWVRQFDSWAICDTACFHLFDRTDFRWRAARVWAADEAEYVRRAGFATLWGLAVHDKEAVNADFISAFAWARGAAEDDRPMVRKAVDMSVRAIGKRNPALNRAALDLTREFSARENRTARWLARHIRKELESERVQKKLGLLG